MGSVSSVPQYLTKVGLDDGSQHTQHTQLLIGTLNAIYWVGVAIGALCIGWLSDKIGRRCALMTSLTLAVVIIPIFTSLQNFA
jgi:MFS family permease